MASRFKVISKGIIQIAKVISSNENLLKYLRVLDDNPLASTKTLSELQRGLIDTRNGDGIIVLGQFDEDILTDTRVNMFISPEGDSTIASTDNGLRISTILVDIVVPNSHYVLEGQGALRGYEIAGILEEELNGMKIDGIVGFMRLSDWGEMKIKTNSTHIVIRLEFEVDCVDVHKVY